MYKIKARLAMVAFQGAATGFCIAGAIICRNNLANVAIMSALFLFNLIACVNSILQVAEKYEEAANKAD